MLVSIIIPCYNVAPYLPRVLDSALGQTYAATEIICVDNNSTDDTLAILDAYQNRFPEKIRVLKEKKQGAPAARNLGMQHAKGEWLQFLDADDELLPDKISWQIGLLEKEPSTNVIIGACKLVAPNGEVSVLQPVRGEIELAFFLSNLGNTLSNLWRRDVIVSVGGWNNEYLACQEYELLSRIILKGVTFLFDDKILCIAYQRENSISYTSPNYYYYNFKLRAFWYEKIKRSINDSSLILVKRRFFNIIKMYGKVDESAALNAFETYFPKLYTTDDLFREGVFYIVAKYLGYHTALRALRIVERVKSITLLGR